MKKRKILFLLPLAGMILSGCSFEDIPNFFTQTIPQEFNKFLDGMLGRKSEEPGKEEKEEKEDQGGEEGGGEEQKEKQLLSISISGQFQEEYDIGEAFNSTGIVVTAAYDDGSSEDVTSQASFSGFDSQQAGPVTVTASFNGQTATFTVNVAKLSWFAEEKALFNDYLHGIELPFLPVEGATVTLSDGGSLNILNPNGENLSVSGTVIQDYADLFLANDGWEDVSSDYSAYRTAPSGSFFVFERSTDTDEGMRRISVQFFGHDGSAYNTSGSFYLFASDPFNYEFPSDLIAEEFELYGFTPFAIPAPDAEDMYFEFYPDSNNAIYIAYGYPEYCNATIYLYGFTQETFDAYLAKLSGAGWILNGTDHDGTMVYDGKLEVEGEGNAVIEQLYFTPTFSALTYDYMIQAPAVWPAEAAAQLVEKFAPGSTTVIPECPGGEKYSSYMSSSYNEIDVEGDESLKDAYAAILREAGWTETEDYVFVSPNQDIQIVLQFTSYGLEIRVSGYTAPSAEWPAEDAAKLLPAGGQDTLPPFEGADSYQYYNDNYGSGITCFVGEGNEDSAMEAYAATLTSAGFTPDDNGFFKSPHAEFKVELWKGTDGAFNIEVSIIAYWPTADVAALLEELVPNGEDSLPALEGAASYNASATNNGFNVAVKFETTAQKNASQEAYIALLEEAGFEYAGDDEYGDPYFNSPHEEFCVNPWIGSSALNIGVYAGPFVAPTAGFPADDINAALLLLDSTLQDKLPDYDTDLIYNFSANSSGTGVQIMAMPTNVETEIGLFGANLLANNFTEAGEDSYGDMHYLSPNGELDVCAWNYNDTYIIIDVEIQ